MKTLPGAPEFRKLAKRHGLVPLSVEISSDLETPVSAYLKLSSGLDTCYLLESVEQGEKLGRYSIIGLTPLFLIRSLQGSAESLDSSGKIRKERYSRDPLEVLETFLGSFSQAVVPELPPFTGGAVGFVSYEYARYLERLPFSSEKDSIPFPDFVFQISCDVAVFDHLKKKIFIISNAITKGTDPEIAYQRALGRIKSMIDSLQKPLISPVSFLSPSTPLKDNTFTPIMKKSHFLKMVSSAKEYIYSGDIIQVVLSQRWDRVRDVEPFTIYRALRSINPSPYMFYLKQPEIELIGSSPEILVKLEGNQAFIRPIAGTKPRGKTEKEDLLLAQLLQNDQKEIAEHIMLVDLGRNDIGRVASFGTVSVPELMSVERYSHVMHLVSTVQGSLSSDKTPFDLFKASFPAGTLSGAPKIRAMEIIAELEKNPRGPYGGAVGYFAFNGNLDFCITIRTIVAEKASIHIQAGAGIVADSVPSREYQETIDKSNALRKAYELAKEFSS
ncbi:MAG: anthranilate synthase component I [Candidatus Ratteibacteria bacterium]